MTNARVRDVLLLVVLCVAVLPACSAPVPDPAAGQAAAVAELERITQTRNPADEAFVRDMIPHHEQGVELADLVPSRTGTLGVRDMAFRITRAQGFEIGQLRGYLTAWRTAPDGAHTGTAHTGTAHTGTSHMETAHTGTAMPGMVAPDRMAALRAARGPEFDRLWLEAMIAHHEGAVAMAQDQQRDGVNRGVRNTAATVISVQRAEIATMRGLLSAGPRS